MAYAANCLGKDTVTEQEIEQWNDDHEDTDEFICVHEFKIVE